jgi:uncharacterized protein (TIGR03067 family)
MKYAVMILFLSASFSIAADDADSKKLLKDLEGSYKITSIERNGETAPAEFLASIEKASIKGDKFTMTFKGKDGKSESKIATITVDAAKKPAQIDLKADDGDKKDETALGIIAIEGETIKICFADASDKRRPAEFKTSKDDSNMLLMFKKTKEQ